MKPFNTSIHHRKSIRLKGYDYSQSGLYFITICCYNKECMFGEISNGTMALNSAGQVAQHCWQEIPSHFPNVVLHEHIIMPNHIHGIIEITDTVGAKNISPSSKSIDDLENISLQNLDEINMKINDLNIIPNDFNENTERINNEFNKNIERTKNDLKENNNRAKNISPLQEATNFRSPSKTIGSIIRGFKIGVTKWMRQNTEIYDVWQRNYYEHIIRNDTSYELISNYILNNPSKWQEDTFYISQ